MVPFPSFPFPPLMALLFYISGSSAIPAPPTTTSDPSTGGFFPNPRLHTFECGQSGRPSWVCDPNGLLKDDTVVKADAIIESIQNSTVCQCGSCPDATYKGFPIGIAVLLEVPTSEDSSSKVVGKQMVDALRTLYWKLGQCGDDIVLLLSIKDGKMYLSVGGVAQRVFHYQCELEVGHSYTTYIRQTHHQDYDGALIHALQDIRSIMTGERKCTSRIGSRLPWWHLLILSLAVVLVVMVVMSGIMVIRRYRNRPR